jgi:toxin ParE1/3/4
VGKVLDGVERLRGHPESGRLVPELTGRIYREVIVPPCRIVYRREGKAILIVYIFRGERMLRKNRLR